MFYLLIKPKGRLPSGNSWVVKRIMGPGLAPDFFFEVSRLLQFRKMWHDVIYYGDMED